MKSAISAIILSAGIAISSFGHEASAKKLNLTKEEVNLIAQVTMAEAEAEPVKGQKLVIDSILNRVESKTFPDTVYGVISQKYQYCYNNERYYKCYPRKDLKKLVRKEAKKRTNDRVYFFCAGGYIGFGTPLYCVGHHYFSTL